MSKPKRKNNTDAKGRRKNTAHIRFYEHFYRSEAVACLSPVEYRVLSELKMRYRPGRNGHISLSIREICDLCRVGKDKATNAFVTLIAHGLIRVASKGRRQGRVATEWELTFEDKNEEIPASNEWKRFNKRQKASLLGEAAYLYRHNHCESPDLYYEDVPR